RQSVPCVETGPLRRDLSVARPISTQPTDLVQPGRHWTEHELPVRERTDLIQPVRQWTDLVLSGWHPQTWAAD
ncbi:hypothetical protein ACFWEJ_28630, partial [Promicromonospora sp. NPDC060204]|uniref:hypothetical protein n=1 Tax=Promicromonospora sp. NPDC060204 TaxID=3347071 RepID=UPI0036480C86